MLPTILAGTDDGVHVLGDGPSVELDGRSIGALAEAGKSTVAVADETEILARDESGWTALASLDSRAARCLLPDEAGLLIGTTEAHLLRLSDGSLTAVEGFASAPGRERWFTPWGGPPATRSLARGAAGELYANVHVGGILRSDDGGASWRQTIEIEVDAHEVLSPAGHPGLLLAATARGLATSRDGGGSWELASDGLRATYARAVALSEGVVLMSASDGPRGGHAAVYRRDLDAPDGFERCTAGLPEWFEDNIDTACLKATGQSVVFGTSRGELYASRDSGETWEQLAEGLPPVRCVALH